MSKDNLKLWDSLTMTDPKHVKPITGKQYKGDSPKPHYVIKRLTEAFGPIGIGWGYNVVDEHISSFAPDEHLHICRIAFWYILDGKKSEPFEQFGQTKIFYSSSKADQKPNFDEDAPKKSLTDALVKCASYIGVAADIFMGQWNDSKYQEEVKHEHRPTKERFDIFVGLLNNATSDEELKKYGKNMRAAADGGELSKEDIAELAKVYKTNDDRIKNSSTVKG